MHAEGEGEGLERRETFAPPCSAPPYRQGPAGLVSRHMVQVQPPRPVTGPVSSCSSIQEPVGAMKGVTLLEKTRWPGEADSSTRDVRGQDKRRPARRGTGRGSGRPRGDRNTACRPHGPLHMRLVEGGGRVLAGLSRALWSAGSRPPVLGPQPTHGSGRWPSVLS